MRISRFSHGRDNEPKHLDCTWDELAAGLGPHDYSYPDKLSTPAFSPAEYLPGTIRRRENVVRLWLFVADLDHLTQERATEALNLVEACGLAAAAYTTWRHAEDPWRLRIVLPLTRPVAVDQWALFWACANEFFGRICDDKCVDPCRLYFGPFAPAGTEDRNFYRVLEGDPLDVDLLLSTYADHVGVAAGQSASRHAAAELLGKVWPDQGRHELHLALSAGLLKAGFSDSEAIDFLCAVAAIQDPHNEDRPKREATVTRSRERIEAGENVLGWNTLSKTLGYGVVNEVRALLQALPALSREQLEHFAKKIKKSNFLGEVLLKICEGEPFEIDALPQLTRSIAREFLDHDARSMARHFAASLQLMAQVQQDLPTEDDLTDLIRRHQRDAREERDKKKEEDQSDLARRIREAFKNGRSTPYTPEELATFGENISKRWIIQHGRSFYLYFNGGYIGPYTADDAQNAMVRDLAPAQSAGVQLYVLSKDGGPPQFKSLKKLVDEYGTVAEHVRLDLAAQRTTYDEQQRCVVEAPCPLRPIKPVFHHDIDLWLQILSADHYENLKTWIAVVTRLDFICVALFLTGEHSVGKSMLALGLSRLWTTGGVTPLEEAFADFNDSIARCPLCFADEKLPTDYRGQPRNAELRFHIQSTDRPYRRKFLPNTSMRGATRTIVAAHSREILRTTEALTNNDIDAIRYRYFHIPVQPEAAAYLESLKEEPEGSTWDRGWVEQDKIAEHALWLRDNHQWVSQGRFVIKAPDEGVYRSLATQSGYKSSVCQWLCSYLLDPNTFHRDARSNLFVRVHQNKLLVNAQGILRCWDNYVGKNERCPQTGILSRTVSDLCANDRLKLPDAKGELTNYRVIEIENIVAWAEESGFSDRTRIYAGLSKDTSE